MLFMMAKTLSPSATLPVNSRKQTVIFTKQHTRLLTMVPPWSTLRTRLSSRPKVDAASVHGPGAVVDKAAKETAVITRVTDGKVAEVFAHYFRDGEHHQNLVAHESLLNYPNRGRELIRNAQDYARDSSYELAALLVAGAEGEEEQKEEKEGAEGWERFWPF